jgi:hypothetical protein
VALGREVALELVHHPEGLLGVLAHPSDDITGCGTPAAECALAWAWAGTARALEALDEQRRSPPEASLITTGEWETLGPLLDRARFVLLSFPFRLGTAQWENQQNSRAAHDVLGGTHDRPPQQDMRVIDTCRRTRQAWMCALNEQESHPLLFAAGPSLLERDLQDLVLIRPDGAIRRGGPLVLAEQPAAPTSSGQVDTVPPTPLDEALAVRVAAHHLLPRAMFHSVHRLAVHYHPGIRTTNTWARRMWSRPALLWAVVVAIAIMTALMSLATAYEARYDVAAGWALATYAVIGSVSLVGGPAWSHPWLLRQPATAAVGAFVLVTLSPHWWLQAHPRIGVGLVAVAWGYLALEQRGHRVGLLAALGRAVVVTGAGLLHSFLVALIFLRWVAPQFAETSDEPAAALARWWTSSSTVPHPGQMLWLATTWCLTAGVFTQILWDDKPLTSALGRLEWRRE